MALKSSPRCDRKTIPSSTHLLIQALRIECLVGGQTDRGIVFAEGRYRVIQAVHALVKGNVRRPVPAVRARNFAPRPLRKYFEDLSGNAPVMEILQAPDRPPGAEEIVGISFANDGRIVNRRDIAVE